MNEFVNPKYTDGTKTAFKKPTRLGTVRSNAASELEWILAFHRMTQSDACMKVVSPILCGLHASCLSAVLLMLCRLLASLELAPVADAARDALQSA
eukprot:2556141-Rhodomonas_salina.1